MMRSRSFALGVLLGGRAFAALAMPQEIIPIFPAKTWNSTTPAPTATDAACENRCSVEYPPLTGVQWIPESQIVYTTKITVATVSVIYRTSDNFTMAPETQTVYGYVPSEYNLYSLGADEEGKAVVTVPMTQSDGLLSWSAITYPTPYIDYSSEYHWQGVLQTHDKAYSPACATASPEPANVPLKLHPEYPQPKGPLSPGKYDQLGQEHKPLWAPIKDEPDKSFFDVAFPSESAFSLCESIPPTATIPTQYSAPKYVTTTTTVYEGLISQPVVIIQPTATGFETESCCRNHPTIPHVETSAKGWETELPSPMPAHDEHSVNGFETTMFGGDMPQPTGSPDVPEPNVPEPNTPEPNTPEPNTPNNNGAPSLPEVIVSIINKNPQVFNPVPNPNAQFENQYQNQSPSDIPTLIFTIITTVIDGKTSTIGEYVPAPTTSIPTLIFTIITTVIDGKTSTIGEYVPAPTSTPKAVYTTIPTTVSGIATSIPAYIISGSSTATLGQTVVLDGKTTVLMTPTGTSGSTGSGPQETGSPQPSNAATPGSAVSWSALLITFGLGFIPSL